ncbi:MAG: transporter substrate-binding domain-containing protein [bacterium]|nr:transporter substrate-binding domain-containing protein [bacterium]
MNKLLKLSIMGVLGLGLFACGKKTTTAAPTTAPTTTATPTTTVKKEEVKILTPSGTPLMAIAGLIGTDGVNIESVNGADNLVTGLTKGSYDMIVAPLTAGTKLYNAGKSKYKLEAVVTTNNTYVIAKGNTTLTNISDLEGKKIVAYGKGNTPDIALRKAFSENSLTFDESLVQYENDVSVAMSTFNSGTTYDYCLIAEPQISKMKTNGANIKVLDLSTYMSTTIYQAGIFVNPDANQTRCNEVIEDIKANITYLNSHPTEYANKVVENDKEEGFFKKMGKDALALSIPNANIGFTKAKDNKDSIKAYFTELISFDPKIIGGMVNDEYFR